ncbi:prolyl oligopeptidase family serine peptidase [Maricaulis sp.]|uniref:alpha/beta hydrolase family protein n=1 Tax=Maricaulis sp. TaxID=1486257 RepID=UPI003A928019
MRAVLGLIVTLLFCGPGVAQVETYAAMPRIWAADLSPDGTHLATGCSPRGVREICIYDLAGGAAPVVIPAPDGGEMSGFDWPGNAYLIYYIDSVQTLPTQDGLRTMTLTQPVSYSLATGRSETLMVNSRLVSPMVGAEGRVAMEITFALDTRAGSGSRIGGRDDSGTVVYEMNLENGRRVRRMEVSDGSTIGYLLNPEGEVVLDIRRFDETGQYSVHRPDGAQSPAIYSGTFPANQPRVYGVMDNGEAVVIRIPGTGLQRLDIATGALSAFDVGGEDVSQMGAIVDYYASEVVGFRYTDDLPRQIFIDPDLAALHAELKQILTEDSVLITTWTPDRSKLVVEGRDPGQPANYYLLDLGTGGLGLLDVETVLPEGHAPGSREYLEYTASDGLAIPAYLTMPAGFAEGDAPPALIVMPHGGPRSRDTAQYDWWASFYAARGYAVFQPNFRGSSGYGEAFERAGYGGFGSRMIDDIIEGAHHVQESGRVRPGQYCVIGGSYGGYAALMTALRDPGNVACALSFAGVTDPFAFLGSRDNRHTSLRYWEQYMGERFGDRDEQATITPAARADELRLPLLIMHGEDDTTVPYGQFRLLRNAMEGRDNVRFVTLPDADHYLGTPEARTSLLRESQTFLDENFPAH